MIANLLARRSARSCVLAVALAIVAGCAALAPMKGRIAGDRYHEPEGEFSVALMPEWGPTQETVFSDRTMVDLMFKRDPVTRGTFGVYTVEWLKLWRAAPDEVFRAAARGHVREHVAKRFGPDGAFAVLDIQCPDEAIRPACRFVAAGTLGGERATWIGEAAFFGDRIATSSLVLFVDTYIDRRWSHSAPRTVAEVPAGLLRLLGSIRRER